MNYPVKETTNRRWDKILLGGLGALCFGGFLLSSTGNSMDWYLMVGKVILLIASIYTFVQGAIPVTLSYYEIKCPKCGNMVYFPVDSTGWDCSSCKTRLIIKNEKIISASDL